MWADPELHARMNDELARYHGYDPSKGPWALVINIDGTTSFDVFEKPEDAWCCFQPERRNALVQVYRDAYAAGYRPAFPDVVHFTFDPRAKDRSTWWNGGSWGDDDDVDSGDPSPRCGT